MLELKELEHFNDELASSKQTSYDETNDAYLINLDVKVYDFDKIKERYVKELKTCLSLSSISSFRSKDALYNKNGKFIFIEFKNGCITSKMGKEKIRSKISESLLILTDILDAKLQEIRNICCCVLVYNKEKNPSFENQIQTSQNKLFTGIANLAKTNHLIEGFDRYRVFFRKFYTVNEEKLENVSASL